MRVDVLSVLSLFTALPFLVIATILVLYLIRKVSWVRRTRVGRLFGIQPSAVGLGMAFLFLQAFWRPSTAQAIDVRQEADVDEDDEGDSETPAERLNQQLKRLRRGEVVDRLVLRL